MTIKKRPLFLTLALLMAAAGYAAAQQTPRELSWDDCVREALANNPGLKAKQLIIDQYKYLLLAGYNVYLPKVSLSHSLSRSGGDNTSPSTRWGVSASASEPLFDLSAMSSIRTSKINYEKTLSDYRSESASLRQSLYSAFMNLLVAQEQISVDKKILGIREQNAKLIQLKYESGMESRGNTMYAAALYELSKANAQKSERALNISRRELVKDMGVSADRPVTAKGELKVPEYDLKVENVKAAMEKIPQVISQEKSIEGYKERLLSAQYSLFPTLNASQSVSWSGPSEFPGKRSWSLGLNLNLPLFSSGITYYPNSTKAARLALQSAEESLKDLKISLESDIISGYDDFLNTRDTAVSNVNVLAANEERYKESQIKYMAGQISFLDLENVEQSMVDAQQNQLQYLRNANARKSALENLLGVGLED
ncbi:MAG: TolC family protein [Elusimicrobia bacterium]|nr:TolC family protein [Elusimicrobiota bacterium]